MNNKRMRLLAAFLAMFMALVSVAGLGNGTYAAAATLTITTQPTDKTVTLGDVATFTVAATGSGTLTYQWQSRKDASSNWSDSGQSGAKSKTLSVVTSTGLNGWQFRCIVKDANGQKISNTAVVYVAPKITTQPKNAYAKQGGTAQFTVAATGKGPFKYQWQSRKDASAAWSNSGQSGAKTATLSVASVAGLNGWQFRCVVTDANGQKAYSDIAKIMTVSGILTQPKNTTVAADSTAKFTVEMCGTGSFTYQWQSRQNAMADWSNSGQTGAKTATLSVAAIAGLNGWQFRCLVADANGKRFVTDAATLYVVPKITTQPKDKTVTAGTTATFTVAATGRGTLTYQWQSRKNSTLAWTNSGQSGAKTATLSVATSTGLNGWQFRCVVTDINGQKSYSNDATLTVKAAATNYVTYKQFGAKGDGKTNDYAAIVATHAYANEHNLPVKADKGAVYYVDKMDASNPKGAIIKTDTDWTGAEFIIDDSKLEVTWSYDAKDRKTVYYPEGWDGNCFLFTVEPSIVYQKTWINPATWWRIKNGKWVWCYIDKSLPGDQQIFIGLDSKVGTFSNPDYLINPQTAYDMINKAFSKDTTKLSGNFGERALYALETRAYQRWGRYGSETASSDLRNQEEVVIVNKDGTIDPNSRLQWDWKEIEAIQKSYIDETQLTVRGGKFTTIVNHAFDTAYYYRGISITRSNVLMEGVEHYLTGEEAEYSKDSFGYTPLYDREDVLPRYGAPYQGFFRLDHCAYVTLKDCVFSNHHRVFGHYLPSKNQWRNNLTSAPYDYYAEYCVGLTLDHCTSAQTIDYTEDYVKGLLGMGPKIDPVYDETGIMDDLRWGVMGTNYCKALEVINGSSVNRVDAHMGTYNLTVKDSTIGWVGILAVGFGKMYLENVESYSKNLVKLRDDYGSAWYGDIEIKNCKWHLGTNYSPRLIYAKYNPALAYGFDPIDRGEKYPDGSPYLYYSQLPTNVTIDGLTLEATNVTSTALFTGGLPIFSNPLTPVKEIVNDAYLMNRTNTADWRYEFPLLAAEKISVKNVTVIKNPALKKTTFNSSPVAVDNTYHGEYIFRNTVFNYDSASTWVVAQPQDAQATAGSTAKFTMEANGSGTLTYQWQARKNSSATWANATQTGAKTATLSVTATADVNGWEFRCIVTGANGKKFISDAAKLTVTR